LIVSPGLKRLESSFFGLFCASINFIKSLIILLFYVSFLLTEGKYKKNYNLVLKLRTIKLKYFSLEPLPVPEKLKAL
jgi:hypothetical protein